MNAVSSSLKEVETENTASRYFPKKLVSVLLQQRVTTLLPLVSQLVIILISYLYNYEIVCKCFISRLKDASSGGRKNITRLFQKSRKFADRRIGFKKPNKKDTAPPQVRVDAFL